MKRTSSRVLQAKVLVLGDANVGKTSLLMRLCENRFAAKQVPTIGIDFKVKELDIGGVTIKLKIWDTAGQERYRNIADSYFKGANGVLLIYACDNRQSFEDVENWMGLIDAHMGPEVAKILVGNKMDSQAREVTYEEGKRFAEAHKMRFFETSAKENENVTELFTMIGKMMFKDIFGLTKTSFKLTDKPESDTGANPSKCC